MIESGRNGKSFFTQTWVPSKTRDSGAGRRARRVACCSIGYSHGDGMELFPDTVKTQRMRHPKLFRGLECRPTRPTCVQCRLLFRMRASVVVAEYAQRFCLW